MRRSCLSRLLVLRAAMQKCLRCSQRPTLGLASGKTRNGPNRRLGRYKNRNGRNERQVGGIKASSSVWREDLNELLLHGHFIVGALEDFSQDASPHLLWLFDAVNVQESRRHVIHAGSQTHQP